MSVSGGKLSIEDFDPMETKRVPRSPRSVYACKSEGVLMKSLLYKPLETYLADCKDE
jgi:hypothetical protein